MIRSFIALPLPSQAARAVAALQQGLPLARTVGAEHLHLTLAFLGEQRETALAALAEELGDLETPPFGVRLSGIALFGDRRSGAIAVNADGGAALDALQARVLRVVRGAGIAVERRRFRPHVTILRLPRIDAEAETARIQRWITATAAYEPVTYVAETMCLFRSRLARSGAVHEVLAEYPFGARGG